VNRRSLGNLSGNLVFATSECDALGQNDQADRYNGASVSAHDRSSDL
jgi:hypothetical protein